MLIPKPTRTRDKPYLIWLRDFPCAFCKAPPPSEASHIRLLSQSGTGLKPSDSRALPSCHACHMKAHQGERTFYGDKLDYYINLAESLYAAQPNKELAQWLLVGSKK
jgi:hypothetical protein